MSVTRPHVVLIDDSETFLALERAALEDDYSVTTALDGAEGLARIRQLRPAAVLVDLHMPNMSGREVVNAMAADPELSTIPIVVVSSQQRQATEIMQLGAADFLVKPVRAPDLVASVARAIASRTMTDYGRPLAVLAVEAGDVRVAFPVRSVSKVLDELATQPLAGGPTYLREMFVLHGEPMLVLDLARRLRQRPKTVRLDRKLLVLAMGGGLSIALRVDRVHDPVELPPSAVRPAVRVAGLHHPDLRALCQAVVVTEREPLVVLRPDALARASVLRRLGSLIARSVEAASAPADP